MGAPKLICSLERHENVLWIGWEAYGSDAKDNADIEIMEICIRFLNVTYYLNRLHLSSSLNYSDLRSKQKEAYKKKICIIY